MRMQIIVNNVIIYTQACDHEMVSQTRYAHCLAERAQKDAQE